MHTAPWSGLAGVLASLVLLAGCEGDREEAFRPAARDALVSFAPDLGPADPPAEVARASLVAAVATTERCGIRVVSSSRLDTDALTLRLVGQGAALAARPTLASCLETADDCAAARACPGCRALAGASDRFATLCADAVAVDGCDLASARCEGSVLHLCAAGVRWTVDCAVGGDRCGHQEWSVPGCYRDCATPSTTCVAGAIIGECHGDTRGTDFDTVASRWACGLFGDRACRKAPGTPAECVPLPACAAPPRCDESTLVVCLAGEAQRIDCAAGGGTCRAAGDFIGCVQGG